MKQKIKKVINSTPVRIFTSLCVGIIVTFVAVTYYYVWVFMHPASLMVNGRLKTEIAAEYRKDLIMHHGAQEISFKSLDGVGLKGLLFYQPQARLNVLLVHGYRGMKETMKSLIPIFKNANIFLFDFRGHGESDWAQITCGFKEALDVRAAAQKMHDLCDKHHRLPLLVLGVSMGGAASIKAIQEEPELFDGLIIDSSYAQLEPMIRRLAKRLLHIKEGSGFTHFQHDLQPVIPFFLRHPFSYFVGMIMNYQAGFVLTAFKPYKLLKKIKKPIAIFHSIVDEVIPVRNAYKLYESAKEKNIPSSLWIAPPCPHAYLNRKFPEQYKEKVHEYLATYFPFYEL